MNNELWFKVGDSYACVPAKCGGTAFYRRVFNIVDAPDSHVFSAAVGIAMEQGRGPYSPEAIAAIEAPKYLAIREPVSRIESLWRDKCFGRDENLPDLHGLSPQGLCDRIEADPLGGSHWMPQFVYLTPGVRLVPYRSLLGALGFEPLVANVTPKVNMAFPVERILRLYAVDALLHRGAMDA